MNGQNRLLSYDAPEAKRAGQDPFLAVLFSTKREAMELNARLIAEGRVDKDELHAVKFRLLAPSEE